jgi:hypothetical protein
LIAIQNEIKSIILRYVVDSKMYLFFIAGLVCGGGVEKGRKPHFCGFRRFRV